MVSIMIIDVISIINIFVMVKKNSKEEKEWLKKRSFNLETTDSTKEHTLKGVNLSDPQYKNWPLKYGYDYARSMQGNRLLGTFYIICDPEDSSKNLLRFELNKDTISSIVDSCGHYFRDTTNIFPIIQKMLKNDDDTLYRVFR